MSPSDTLGTFQQLVMLAVLRVGPDAYGARLQEELEERAGHGVTIGTVYVTLDRLQGKGLVRSWKGPPTPVRGGKARRLYEVTPRGLSALQQSRDVLDRMWEGVDVADRAS